MTNQLYGRICPECAAQRKAAFQKDIDLHIDKIQDWIIDKKTCLIKAEFIDPENKAAEHMFVTVLSAVNDAQTLIGILENDPVRIQNVKYHDTVAIPFKNLEEVYYMEDPLDAHTGEIIYCE